MMTEKRTIDFLIFFSVDIDLRKQTQSVWQLNSLIYLPIGNTTRYSSKGDSISCSSKGDQIINDNKKGRW